MHQPSTMLDHPLVSSRYFFPRREAFPHPYWVDAADGSKLACSYHEAHPAATTVVYFHGNGEVVADYLPGFPDWLTQAVYNEQLPQNLRRKDAEPRPPQRLHVCFLWRLICLKLCRSC